MLPLNSSNKVTLFFLLSLPLPKLADLLWVNKIGSQGIFWQELHLPEEKRNTPSSSSHQKVTCYQCKRCYCCCCCDLISSLHSQQVTSKSLLCWTCYFGTMHFCQLPTTYSQTRKVSLYNILSFVLLFLKNTRHLRLCYQMMYNNAASTPLLYYKQQNSVRKSP